MSGNLPTALSATGCSVSNTSASESQCPVEEAADIPADVCKATRKSTIRRFETKSQLTPYGMLRLGLFGLTCSCICAAAGVHHRLMSVPRKEACQTEPCWHRHDQADQQRRLGPQAGEDAHQRTNDAAASVCADLGVSSGHRLSPVLACQRTRHCRNDPQARCTSCTDESGCWSTDEEETYGVECDMAVGDINNVLGLVSQKKKLSGLGATVKRRAIDDSR